MLYVLSGEKKNEVYDETLAFLEKEISVSEYNKKIRFSFSDKYDTVKADDKGILRPVFKGENGYEIYKSAEWLDEQDFVFVNLFNTLVEILAMNKLSVESGDKALKHQLALNVQYYFAVFLSFFYTFWNTIAHYLNALYPLFKENYLKDILKDDADIKKLISNLKNNSYLSKNFIIRDTFKDVTSACDMRLDSYFEMKREAIFKRIKFIALNTTEVQTLRKWDEEEEKIDCGFIQRVRKINDFTEEVNKKYFNQLNSEFRDLRNRVVHRLHVPIKGTPNIYRTKITKSKIEMFAVEKTIDIGIYKEKFINLMNLLKEVVVMSRDQIEEEIKNRKYNHFILKRHKV